VIHRSRRDFSTGTPRAEELKYLALGFSERRFAGVWLGYRHSVGSGAVIAGRELRCRWGYAIGEHMHRCMPCRAETRLTNDQRSTTSSNGVTVRKQLEYTCSFIPTSLSGLKHRRHASLAGYQMLAYYINDVCVRTCVCVLAAEHLLSVQIWSEVRRRLLLTMAR